MAKILYNSLGVADRVELGMRLERNPTYRSLLRPSDNSEELKRRLSPDYRHGVCKVLTGKAFEDAAEDILRRCRHKLGW